MINQNIRGLPFKKRIALLPLALGIAANGANAAVLEEIVVTAQKRAQSLNEVGIAVTAFSGDDISKLGIEQPSDLAAQTPNLTVKNASGAAAPVFTIRGVGLNSFVSNVNPSVAVYVDEVYQVNTSMMSFGLFDVDRVEVLKGPQGTLFGRNTTGGAVSFVTKKPTEETEAYVRAGIGDYELFELEGAASGALSDTLTGRVSFISTQQGEGFFKNRVTGHDHGEVDRIGWRAQLLWNPNDGFSALLNLHGGRDKSDQWMLVHRGTRGPGGVGPCATGAGEECFNAQGYRDIDGDLYEGDYNLEPEIDNEGSGATLTLNWDFGSMTLTSVTNVESFEYFREEEFDASPNLLVETNYDGELEQFSQELRVTSNDWDGKTLIAGLFYSDDSLDEVDFYNVINNPLFQTIYDVAYEQDTETLGAFIHTEWDISDQLKLTVGARITDEEVTYDGGTVDRFPATSGLGQFGLTGSDIDTAISETEPSGKIGLDWTPNDDWLLYVSYSRGVKSGGFNGSFAVSNAEVVPFDKEILDAYEAGFKATLAKGSLQLNGAFYYYDYQDLQVFDTDLITFNFILTNAGEAEVTGFELEAHWLPTDALDIRLGVGYSDTEITEYSDTLATSAEGNVLANTPEWTVNGVISYHWVLGDNLRLDAAVDFNWQDDLFFTIANDPRIAEDSYMVTNASLALTPQSDKWEVRAWVKNLAEEEYFTEQFLGGPGGLASGTPGAPRTFGLELTYRWN